MASRHQDFITLARQHAAAIWEGVQELKAMQSEWNALNYGDELADGAGSNEGYTKAEVGAAIFAAADAFEDLLNGTLDGQNLPGAQAENLARLL